VNNIFARNLAIAGLALCAACATAQSYPVEFDISPVTTSVATNTSFLINIIAKSTDGANHGVAIIDLNLQLVPSLYNIDPTGPFSPVWYTGDNGFSFVFGPTTEGSDGWQLGVQGPNNPDAFHPGNVTITPGGVAVMTLSFKSTGTTGTGAINLLANYGNNESFIYYNGASGLNQVNATDVNGNPNYGLNSGTVVVGSLPEPVSMATLAVGVLGLLARRARSRR